MAASPKPRSQESPYADNEHTPDVTIGMSLGYVITGHQNLGSLSSPEIRSTFKGDSHYTEYSYKSHIKKNNLIVDKISGVVIQIEDQIVLIEFDHDGVNMERKMSIDQIKLMGITSLTVGDKLQLISMKSINGLNVQMKNLGSSTSNLDPQEIDELDEIYRKYSKKKK